ncbi:hypothetical protein [Neopusillimonas aromaticivorans]|uniref:hypothetical protein n=1 Tax=Neopusillimonas aromaticivorans TaxID=2979868 RepID=UPI0025951D2E|nr:hypothetical protein [Neopusillimonas aromaticivorans]WJJ92964.1 hypothetical protein N7E01_12415 [Neopusillimonas aromaticivorans]
MTDTPIPALTFTDEELDYLGRTADALSAYLGKPVLAEVIDADETGFEWVVFGIPLDVGDDADDHVIVAIGGQNARIIGNKGGIDIKDGDIYDCEYLWAIQLSDLEGVRFIKVDHDGEEVAWSDDIGGILPFELSDEPVLDIDDDEDDSDEGDDDNSAFQPHPSSPVLH